MSVKRWLVTAFVAVVLIGAAWFAIIANATPGAGHGLLR